MKVKLLLTLLILLPWTVSVAAPPSPTTSEYLVTVGGGFLLIEGKPLYAMNYEIIKPLPEGATLTFSFQNPKNKKAPLTKPRRYETEDDAILLQSPLLDCIRNNKRYTVEVFIHEGDEDSKIISKHKQKIEFALPDGMMEQAGIPEC